MKIIHYCQHVLGIGHLVRTIEILKEFEGHDVILVNGGKPVELPLPAHVREFRLPVLMMDREFKGLFPLEPGMSLEETKVRRRHILFDLIANESPDLFILELFPFGRRAFSFEIVSALDGIRVRKLPCRKVACSLRDILVESKKYWDRYEKEVVENLNRYFHILLVHSDPRLIRLEDTFTRTDQIKIPVLHTGYVAQKPTPDARKRIRAIHGIRDDERLIIVSVGGGNVGALLLESVLKGFNLINRKGGIHLMAFSGPFMPEKDYERLRKLTRDTAKIIRFTPDFLSYVAAADLSVSMAGYNTCMNILAAHVPALVWPFDQNREQKLRAERFARIGGLKILKDSDLSPERLALIMETAMAEKFHLTGDIDLSGAACSAGLLMKLLKDAQDRYGQ